MKDSSTEEMRRSLRNPRRANNIEETLKRLEDRGQEKIENIGQIWTRVFVWLRTMKTSEIINDLFQSLGW